MSAKAIYVVLHPRSNSNPTDQYRVANSDDVRDYLNGYVTGFVASSFTTYEEAKTARDELNT